jgi:hypothetical protein
MAIDLRKEFDEILRSFGHKIIYARVTDMPCTEPIENHDRCKKCLGTGRVLEYEGKVVRKVAASIPESWPRATNLKAIGNWQIPAYMYYMRYDTNPQSMDLIIDGDQILGVSFVDPLKGNGGRTEYYRVAVEYKITKQQLI